MKNYLGGGYKLSKILIGVSILVIIGTAIVGRITHAGFKSSISVPLANGHITYKKSDFSLVSLYVEDESGEYNATPTVPTGNYEVNTSKTYCTKPSGSTQVNDPNVKVIYEENSLTFKKVTAKDTKCYVYLDKIELPTINVSQILAKYTKNTSRSGQITAPFTGSTPTTVYSKADSSGTSYVFAGVNPNNWVKLGDIYFRIIRFNGDGTIRLIFSGSGSPKTSGAGTQIGENKFNSSNNDNMYVGLQYTSGNAHGTGTNSTILGTSTSTDTKTLYGWYNSKIKPNYESIIDTNAGFCSDRRHSTSNTGAPANPGSAGKGTTTTYYAARYRYFDGVNRRTSYTPELKCLATTDKLKIPVGLITADEYALAGGGVNFDNLNTTFWLHTGEYYWTMSPCHFTSSFNKAYVFYVFATGYLNEGNEVSFSYGVRPVINLKSTTTFIEGTGTSTDPYIVKTP